MEVDDAPELGELVALASEEVLVLPLTLPVLADRSELLALELGLLPAVELDELPELGYVVELLVLGDVVDPLLDILGDDELPLVPVLDDVLERSLLVVLPLQSELCEELEEGDVPAVEGELLLVLPLQSELREELDGELLDVDVDEDGELLDSDGDELELALPLPETPELLVEPVLEERLLELLLCDMWL